MIFCIFFPDFYCSSSQLTILYFCLCLFRSTMRWSVTCWTRPRASWTWEKTQREWSRLPASPKCLPSMPKRWDRLPNPAPHVSFTLIKTFRFHKWQLHTPQRNTVSVLSDHGTADEGEQTAHPGAHGRQPDVVPLPRCAAGGRQAAEPLPRRPAGGPLRAPLHDRPRWLRTSSTGACLYTVSWWLKFSCIGSCTGRVCVCVCGFLCGFLCGRICVLSTILLPS